MRVFGEAPYENKRVLSQVCFIKESQKYPNYFRVNDVRKLCPDIFPNWDQPFADQLLNDFRLPLKRDKEAISRHCLRVPHSNVSVEV
ncbi:hypothetical protein LAV79_12750 [Peribacillus butanolivorans]|uniref:hypothetical protein n=1 Tax=Peribacillus butanolivorans TaxID=421767 RepID=UPI0030C94787